MLRTGGTAVATSDNPLRLERLLDPRSTPLLRVPRAAARHALAAAGLVPSGAWTVGFPPPSAVGFRLVPQRLAPRWHAALERAAERGLPAVRSLGSQCVIQLTKPPDAHPDLL